MGNASNQYLRDAVLTAPPAQLQLMLYDGAIRFARQGIDGITRKDWETAFNGFSRAQRILLEMLSSLNYDVDKSLCTRMAGLYNFIYRQLVQASINRDAGMAQEAVGLLEYQRETWVMLIEKLQAEASTATEAPAGESAGSDAEHSTISFRG